MKNENNNNKNDNHVYCYKIEMILYYLKKKDIF